MHTVYRPYFATHVMFSPPSLRLITFQKCKRNEKNENNGDMGLDKFKDVSLGSEKLR